MSRTRLTAAAALAALPLALPATASAAGPEHFETSSTYTLADAVADYRAFGEHSGDCGDFVLLVDFTVERNVARWPDREVRHIQYIGHVYSSADTSRSIVRGGDFNLTVWLDSNGAPYAITRTGVFEYVEIDGRRVVTHVGRDELDFATGPISATPKAGDAVRHAVCDALS
ncbi:MAG TPA: hypothetical protein VFB74_18695 [Kribbellaceae bacterium]|nr:hypothetical protein [Kribbellaceae bacterium]